MTRFIALLRLAADFGKIGSHDAGDNAIFRIPNAAHDANERNQTGEPQRKRKLAAGVPARIPSAHCGMADAPADALAALHRADLNNGCGRVRLTRYASSQRQNDCGKIRGRATDLSLSFGSLMLRDRFSAIAVKLR